LRADFLTAGKHPGGTQPNPVSAVHFSAPSVSDGNAEYVNSSARTRGRRMKTSDKNVPVYLAIVYMSIRLSLISFLNQAHSPLLERALCADEKLSRETGASLLLP